MDYFVQVVKHSADTEKLTSSSYCANMRRSRATFHGGTKDVKRPIDIFLFPSYFIPWCLINVSTNYVVSVNPILDLKFIIRYVYQHL